MDADNSVEVVICDTAMPGLRGERVAVEIRATRPDLPFVFLSGFDRPDEALDDLGEAFAQRLTKPVTWNELRRALWQAAGKS